MFIKGQSGNPFGRPKEYPELKAMARTYTVEAVETLVKWMRSDNAKASVAAASLLLDRGYGKAAQFLEVTKKDPFEGLETNDIIRIAIALGVQPSGASGGIVLENRPNEAASLPAIRETEAASCDGENTQREAAEGGQPAG